MDSLHGLSLLRMSSIDLTIETNGDYQLGAHPSVKGL